MTNFETISVAKVNFSRNDKVSLHKSYCHYFTVEIEIFLTQVHGILVEPVYVIFMLTRNDDIVHQCDQINVSVN